MSLENSPNLDTSGQQKPTRHRPALSIFEAIRAHFPFPDMITDGHYISSWLTKHGHRCGIASLLTGLRGRGVADDKGACEWLYMD